MSGKVIVIPDIPVTIMLDQLTLIHLNIQQKVSICTSSFRIGLNIWICEGKHLVTVKCAHILLPLVILVTSTNKSVRCDICIIREIGKIGKQYLNIVRVCLHFVQQKYMIMNTTAIHMSWPENQGILFFYISKTLQMIRISFMASLLNAVL